MGNLWRISQCLLIALMLAGCGHTPREQSSDIPSGKFDLNNKPWVKQTLYAQYDQWRAVKYRIGGLSREGVDCSGFVYLTFRSRFGINLPRSTDLQVNVGKTISQDELTPGDLVFFKTGKNVRHVGIYLEDSKFLHASTDRGVMISRLDDIYWSKTYWKSVRVPVDAG